MKLIVENDFRDYEIIFEQKNANEPRFIRVKGPYIVAEKKNANGRIYRQGLMERAVQKFITEVVEPGKAFGELNHPPTAVINLERACHRITSLTQDKNVWVGESIVLCSNPQHNIHGSPMGDVLASVIQHGGRPGMSTRGVGEISESGVIDTDFALLTVDAVSDPSAPGCYVNGILESKEFLINAHGELMEIAVSKFENGLIDIPTHSTHTAAGDAHVKALLENFLKSIG